MSAAAKTVAAAAARAVVVFASRLWCIHGRNQAEPALTTRAPTVSKSVIVRMSWSGDATKADGGWPQAGRRAAGSFRSSEILHSRDYTCTS